MVVEANLPSGVIRNNTEAVSGDIQKIDTLTVEELAKLWRAYSTKQKLLANDVGRRLENFFWRIWSNDHIRTTIRGNQVALIFGDISQGHIIRTTPTSSPRNSRLYGVHQHASQTIQASDDAYPDGENDTDTERIGRQRPQPQQLGSSDTIIPRKNSETGERERSRPPPILKKSGSEYSTSNKTARIQTPGWKTIPSDPDHDEPMSPAEYQAQRRIISPKFSLQEEEEEDLAVDDAELSPTTIVSPSPTSSQPPSSEKMTRTGSNQGSSSGMRGKKKPSFVVSSSRKRPVMGRRQSSQTTLNAGKITSPGLKATRRPSEEVQGSGLPQNQSGLTQADSKVSSLELCVSRSHSPVSESPFRRTGKDHEALENTKTPESLHREAAGLLAPRSQWMSVNDGSLLSSDMRRIASASGAASSAMPKAALASASSSNLQITGTMTPTDSASATPARQSMLGRAASLFKGKGKAAFDIGPPETDSDNATRRTSVEVDPSQRFLSNHSSSHSRSQSQLSGLLDQERRRSAYRDRNSSGGEQGGTTGRR